MTEYIAKCARCGSSWFVTADHLPESDEAVCPNCQLDRDVEMPLFFRLASAHEIEGLNRGEAIEKMIEGADE